MPGQASATTWRDEWRRVSTGNERHGGSVGMGGGAVSTGVSSVVEGRRGTPSALYSGRISGKRVRGRDVMGEYVYIHMYVYFCAHMYVYIYIYIHTCIYVYTYI